MQKTLKRKATLAGTGIFTGESVSMTLMPALPNSGIAFQRVDLPNRPIIPAKLEFVHDTFRSTRLATKSASLLMVEHLLSALSAYEIDNALIEVDGPEIPVGDGSSLGFVELIERAEVAVQHEPRQVYCLKRPIFWSENEIHMVALPSEEFRLSYTLHYPESKRLSSQYYSYLVSKESYASEIAPCRTFALYEEIAPFIEKGLIKGGRLENAVIVKDEGVLNPEGLRFHDEMVRHKVLDLLGDLYLLGRGLRAHVIAIRSGHTSNVAFARELEKEFRKTGIEPALNEWSSCVQPEACNEAADG